MENIRNFKMPQGAGAGGGTLARVLVLGGAAVYGLANSLFNVEGGHRYVQSLIYINILEKRYPKPRSIPVSLD